MNTSASASVIKTRGSDFYIFNLRFGPVHWIIGIDYTRYLENTIVVNNLKVRPGQAILDVGPGWYSMLPVFLSHKGCRVDAIDVDANNIRRQVASLKIAGLTRLIKQQRLRLGVGDIRHLSLPSESFDAVTCLSTLEHIADENGVSGDTLAIREIARVLKPGGVAVLTVPVAHTYEENSRTNWVNYFERRYDKKALCDRVIIPSGLRLDKFIFFGEKGFRFSRLLWLTPFSRYLMIPLRPLLPLAAQMFLSLLPDEYAERAGGCVVVLTKPEVTKEKD